MLRMIGTEVDRCGLPDDHARDDRCLVWVTLRTGPATSAEARTWARSIMTGLFVYWLRGQ
jgi:hypothetical protein